ncbi:MAG: hypothetical protein ACE5H0_15270 [Bacteroidota bacterium]
MRLTRIFHPIQGWIVRNPALFSGLIIYGYYLATSLDFLSNFFRGGGAQMLDVWDYVSQFDALPVMWLLAHTFVRSLNLKERMHEEEKKVLEQKRRLEIQATQLQTVREVTLTLMDKINNPVAIIIMYLRRLKKKLRGGSDAQSDYEMIRKAAVQISSTLKEVSATDEYKVLETPYGRVLDI